MSSVIGGSATNWDRTRPCIAQIEDVVADIPGWTPVDQLLILFSLVHTTTGLDGDIIELGSWCGRSSTVLALAASYDGWTKVHCIDLFPKKDDWYRNADGTYSFSVTIAERRFGAYQHQTVWKEPFEKDIAPLYHTNNGVFERFQESLRKAAVSHLVAPHRGTIETFSESAPSGLKCRVAFLDGDHSYDAVCNDIEGIERYLVPGGWLCFDDAFSHYDGVDRAITDKVINSANYELCQQMSRKLFIARRRQ